MRLLGEELRREKESLGALVTLEVGKIAQEGLGEVQEMIDICDFAVGLSRQLYGRSIASERPGHRLTETWHPLGPVAVISAFNFPVAVWSWNAALAFVCGDPVIWKPSERTPLTALACMSLFERAAERFGGVPDGLAELVIGGADRAVQLADDPRIPLVSATGSTQMGKELAPRIAARLGRSLLELGGNNAAIVAPSADLDLVVRGVLFSAVGTAGQRCTSLRRLIVHESIADDVVDRLASAYRSVPIGDPREPGTLVGPLISADSFARLEEALDDARADGGEVVAGGERALADEWPDAWYASPTLVRMPAQSAVVERETFAPLLYVLTYAEPEEAIAIQNGVPAGSRVVDLHDRPARGRALPRELRLGLRHRERQHRPERCRDRRRVRRREGDRRRARVGLGRLEGVHAPADRDGELHERAAARPGHRLRRSLTGERPASAKLEPMRVRLFTDGGARGNPGPAAAAFVLEREDGTVLDARGDAIGVQTNNVAEYTALVNGLRRAAELGVTEVEVVSDSELMVKQMRGEYKIKNAALRELSLEAARLARAVGAVTYTAVRREHNKLADQLVNDALDASA